MAPVDRPFGALDTHPVQHGVRQVPGINTVAFIVTNYFYDCYIESNIVQMLSIKQSFSSHQLQAIGPTTNLRGGHN